jgi:hypothetical protein
MAGATSPQRTAPAFLDKANEDDHIDQGRLFWPPDFRDEVLAVNRRPTLSDSIPVPTEDLGIGERVILATPALRLHGEAVPAAIGKLGIESRSDASSGECYVLASVRGDGGVARARFSEAEWKSLTSVGRVEELG